MSYLPEGMFPAANPETFGGFRQGASGSAISSEKNARDGGLAVPPRGVTASAPTGAAKPRSCVTCRTRKVRCDKTSPCSNCRRANIPCVFPDTNKPPRWARRLERVANNAKAAQDADQGVNQVMDRLRSLETLVKELSGQLEQANAASGRGSSSGNSPENSNQYHGTDQQTESSSAANVSSLNQKFGRLVVGGSGQSHYVSSGFWSRVNDELDGLKIDAEGIVANDEESSEDEYEDSPGKSSSTQEIDRTPLERHAFLFRHNPATPEPNLRKFHPLPSQIPYLLNIFSENINIVSRVVHVPTISKMLKDVPDGNYSVLAPGDQALLFAIYYATITSMEEDDITNNFGIAKSELIMKYRLGLEYALAKADFLNSPTLAIVQAFIIFLFLARRYDSPRFVWMMVGLTIRMAQSLGFHRDGSRFPHLTPFEVEMRRRVWWALCAIDVRASEDQGTDLTITHGSYDTKLPLNINDSDINQETKETPTEREGITDMAFALVFAGQMNIAQRMVALSLKDGAPRIEEQERLLTELYENLEQKYLRYSNAEGNIGYWVSVTVTRLLVAKMTLIIYFPVLFSTSSPHATDELRAKLFVKALEIAEYNHALNAEPACRHWRWIFQTYVHWYAVVYLLIEATRRPWSPVLERAWVALHSTWLIPVQRSPAHRYMRIWVPLRKLMAKARRHRDEELRRIRGDPLAARALEELDRGAVQPASPGPFPGEDGAESFRERWRLLLDVPPGLQQGVQGAAQFGDGVDMSAFAGSADANIPGYGSAPSHSSGTVPSQPSFDGSGFSQSNFHQTSGTPASGSGIGSQSAGPPHSTHAPASVDWSDARSLGSGFGAWIWADADPSVDVFADMNTDSTDLNLDFDGDVDWNTWVESAKGMEWSSGEQAPGSGWP
ncbi:hypothetical protein M426DRAFT_324789 [Hypoxylon sp. CI-4A]|nr:hypothetical protein M426DRAFT_324789 [Hypoxylon sp. CI-4A]